MPFTIRPDHRFPVQCFVMQVALLLKLPLASYAGFWSLITLLLLSVGPVYAEWVEVVANDEVGMTAYVDPDTIHTEGNLVKVWTLFDYKTIQTIVGGPWLSSKTQRQFDCVEERVRVVGFITFTGNMGSGETVNSNSDEQKWRPIQPGSVEQALWKVVCKKK